jgi:hypothetical protein
MAKEKNKPVPVRFDLKLLEVLKEEEKIDTPQQALNFLAHFWENNRPAKDGVADNSKEVTGDRNEVTGDRKEAAKKGSLPKVKEGGTIAHPSGLSGIDLSIWKAEQKEKNNPSVS